VLVPDRARKCVLFVGIKSNGNFLPRATAFVVSISEDQHKWRYVVTAEHVVVGLLTKEQDIWIRVNSKNGPPQEIKIDPSDWWHHPDIATAATDVVALPVALDDGSDVDAVPIFGPTSVAATRDVIDDVRIGVGDEVVVTGLFRSHHGQQRNVPITRIGNIAMLDAEPVKTTYGGYIDAYLIEARSIGGHSGSPAFVHLPALRTIDGKTPLHRNQKTFQLYLLGLMHGHFDVEDLNADVVLEDQRDATSGIHAGIGVVVPVEKIIETIMQPALIEVRRKIVEEHRANNGAGSDLTTQFASATDENLKRCDPSRVPKGIAMDAERLFVERCRQLENLMKSHNEIDLLDVSAILRQLLLDDTPLAHKANQKHRIKFSFIVGLFRNAPDEHTDFLILEDGVDPQTRPPGSPSKEVNFGGFIKHEVLFIKGHGETIRDVIKHGTMAAVRVQ
jgi:hypothetical protein